MFALARMKKEEATGVKSARVGDTIVMTLLTKEIAALEQALPKTCKLNFPNKDDLRHFHINVVPKDGMWNKGKFVFEVEIPVDYNMSPPKVKCHTKIWHPNITEQGDVCLSLLRQASLDGTGWSPVRTLTDVVIGIDALFADLCNFEDPLNEDAAKQFNSDKAGFQRKVNQYIQRYASY
eukprot:TRINITY_DN917_c0_g1_i1.p1 TRINITY_DN917_c0_g1~~TRINITY_DN917_c0_g1_i1.p1  ORF type:complete len:179 (+),score=25.43 TRINITY_DN917_c0_g1_i1:65-601(+)